jgi:hypothetical protein
MNITNMPNRVRQFERIALNAMDRNRFFIMPERSVAVMQVPFNLSQVGERSRQSSANLTHTTESDRLDQIPPGIVKPMLSPRLKSLPQKFVG